MPIRTATVTKRILKNGQALSRARQSRLQTTGADREPSKAEMDLLEERRQLKEERDKRHAQSLQPKPKAIDRLLRTHHAQPKEKPRATKESHDTKKPKAHRTRAEKHAEKAAALEAARRSPKRAAK